MSEQQIDFPRDIESFLQRLSNKNSKWVFYNVQDFGAQYRRVILGLSRQVEQMHLKTVGVVADNYKKKSTDDTEGAKEALNGLIASLEAVDIPIILSDLHDFQYTTDESRQAFYWDLIKRGEKSENENFALACSVQIGEFLRRHGMPDAAIKKFKPMMIEEFADKLSLRSSAGYELAQAFRIKGDTEAGATYLHNSGKDAIRAGEPVKGLRIQEESYWWLAQDNPAGDARFDIAGAKTHFEQMLESEAHQKDERDIMRGILNCNYHLAWVAWEANLGTRDEHAGILEQIEKPEFFVDGWITVEDFTGVAGRAPNEEIMEALRKRDEEQEGEGSGDE